MRSPNLSPAIEPEPSKRIYLPRRSDAGAGINGALLRSIRKVSDLIVGFLYQIWPPKTLDSTGALRHRWPLQRLSGGGSGGGNPVRKSRRDEVETPHSGNGESFQS